MSCIFYYSKTCQYCKPYIQFFSKSAEFQRDIHFVCTDNRTIDPKTKQIYLLLDNGNRIILPKQVTSVPALYFINDGNVLYGDDIKDYINPRQIVNQKMATQGNIYPEPTNISPSGSDGYSYLESDSASSSSSSYVDYNSAYGNQLMSQDPNQPPQRDPQQQQQGFSQRDQSQGFSQRETQKMAEMEQRMNAYKQQRDGDDNMLKGRVNRTF